MIRFSTIIVIAALGLCGLVPRAFASFDQLSNDVRENSEQADPNRAAQPQFFRSLYANCDISEVLGAALGDRNSDPNIVKSLDAAEFNLREVARGMPGLIGKKLFQKPLKTPIPGFTSNSARAASETLKNGDDCLALIGRLADQSAAAIAAMRDGVGSASVLTLLISNNADILQLILLFNAIGPVKS
jgi:hypothetical protein